MVSLIEFLMFDLDADGFVGVEEAVELFYRRYGREVLFKKEGVKGMTSDNATGGNLLSFHDFVKHDLAFYSISRQMADRAAYVTAKKREQEEVEKVEKAKKKEEPQPGQTNVSEKQIRGSGGPATGPGSPRSPRNRANSIVGGQLHVRLFDADAQRSTALDSVDETDAAGPTPRSRRGKVATLEQDLGGGDKSPRVMNNSLAKFAAMQERVSNGARGHLVTRNSSRMTEAGTTVENEAEQEERVPERITAKEALLKQETLKVRRGSEVIYTFHGLSNAAEDAGQR
jgi:hypothetical protein